MKSDTKALSILYSHRTRGRDVEGVHIRGISDGFRQLGHNVLFVSIPGVDVYESVKCNTFKADESNLWNVISEYCPQLVFEVMELFYNVILYKNTRNILRKEKIDFIYERHALNTFATTLLGKLYGVPVIQEINDATGISRIRRHKLEFIARLIERWVFNNAAALITISSEFERILLERGFPKDKISFVPNAVDPKIFSPEDIDDSIRNTLGLQDKIVLGFVGSFAFWHGVESILEIAPDLIRETPKVHFLMVGSGPQLEPVRERVDKIGLREHFSFPGKVLNSDVPMYLKAMDIGLIPNSNSYGSPMKLFEYMAMGIVPIVPELPPMVDVIKHGKTGLIFKSENKDDMRKQINIICSDQELRNQISKNAREQVMERHLWSHNVRHILNVFSKINK